MQEEQKHHNNSFVHSTTTHELHTSECDDYIKNESVHQDPYNNNATIDCYVPHIKIVVGKRKTTREEVDASGNKTNVDVYIKTTAIVILDNDRAYMYRVDGKDIMDVNDLTNNHSFMEFERYDAKMTNFSDWDESNSDDDREERTFYVVTDAFEAVPVTIGVVPALNNYNRGYYSGQYDFDGDGINDTEKDSVGGPTEIRKDIDRFLRDLIKNDSELIDDVKEMLKTSGGIDVDQRLKDAGIEIYTGSELAVIKNQKDSNNVFTEEARTPPANAAPKDTANGLPDYYTAAGEAVALGDDVYIRLKGTTLAEAEQALKDLNDDINDNADLNEKLKNFMLYRYHSEIYSYRTSHNLQWTKVIDGVEGETNLVTEFGFDFKVAPNIDENVIIYPVEKRVTTIKQTVKHREMPIYLPRKAITWSGEKKFENTYTINAIFDPEFGEGSGGYFQLVPRATVGQGVIDITVKRENKWRSGFFARYFSQVREADVLAMFAEWEEAGLQGQFAAYTYMRDLYALIHKSKDIMDSEGNPYVHPDSYTYTLMPDEILYFDESITDKAFWLERLLATPGEDAIKKEENLTMRTKRNVKTWQVVEYDKYDECIEKDNNGNPTGTVNVYALWPLGGYLGRSLYAFEANSSTEGNEKIEKWGAYVGPGVHSGLDLYGRGNALRIYKNAFDNNGNPKIKAEYIDENEISLTDGTNTVLIKRNNNSSNNVTLGGQDEGVNNEPAHGSGDESGNISGNTNQGAYMNTNVTINIDGTEVTFGGSTSAVYAYELYRLTKAYKNGDKAALALKKTLQQEMSDTPVVAIAPGEVTDVKGGARPGFKVTIKHADGTQSAYLHMKRWPEVQVGEYVGAGTILGYEGTTGNSGGNHVHHEMTIGGTGARYPIPRLYPFFTPFYYEAKASEAGYAIESDYMSPVRTVFPVGQVTEGNDVPNPYKMPGNPDGFLDQVEDNSDGEILIKNYTPSMELTTYAELIKPESIDQKTNLHDDLNSDLGGLAGVSYSGDSVTALPQYFDKAFMDLVKKNGGHILIDAGTTP